MKDNFLSGGGEMGQLIREFPWERTSIGSPDRWPQSLRTILAMILNSKFPMFLFWGPDLLCFYNDPFRPSLGVEGKHPAIGKKGKEVWSDIWEFIGPLIDQVITQGIPVWFEDQLVPFYRNGKIEDIYWTFSYSPVQDETGAFAGVVVICTETTGKINHLAQVKESKDQLAFALEAGGFGTWDYNPLTGTFSANNRLKEWFGLGEGEEIDLQLALDAIVEKDRLRVSEAIREALEYDSGGHYDIEYAIVNKTTGRRRIVRAKGLARFNEAKEAFRMNGTLQDVTDQAIIRDAQEENRKLISILEASSEFIALASPEGDTEYANPAALSMLGWDDVKGRTILDCVYPEDRPIAMTLLPQLVAEGSFQREIRFWNEQTGEPFWLQWNGITIRTSGSGNITGLATISPDITERKLSEVALRESEERFRTLAETLPQLVWMTDDQGHQLYASSRWLEYSGIQATGMDSWQQIIHPGDLGQVGREWTNSLEKKTVYRAEARLRNRKGDYRWHYVQGEPIRNEKGEVIKWIGAFTDIHDQKESEQKLEALVAERTADLARSNADLEQFAHVASHDLKEPVRKIKLFANRIQEEMRESIPERGKVYLDKIQKAAERMLNMIEGVLAYSSNDQTRVHIEKVDLGQIVNDIRTDLDMLFHQKRAQLFCDALPVFEGATVLIYQLFYNLVNNSLKFVRPDVQPEIRITCTNEWIRDTEYVKIRVSDNGIGFQQEHAHTIFESFARLHPKDKFEGTGLGLALCKKIVLRHHGMINAYGELNRGTVIEVLLPVAQENKSL